MDRNTFRTVLRFFPSLFRRWGAPDFTKASIEQIYNYLPIEETLTTSGQPSERQLKAIKDAGYGAVINLAPHHAENALKDEAGALAELGLPYIHIPVDFRNPTEADFQQFRDAVAARQAEKLWVHCAANMRVSAFVYRLRTEVRGEDPAQAQADLHKIWRPHGVWRRFLRFE